MSQPHLLMLCAAKAWQAPNPTCNPSNPTQPTPLRQRKPSQTQLTWLQQSPAPGQLPPPRLRETTWRSSLGRGWLAGGGGQSLEMARRQRVQSSFETLSVSACSRNSDFRSPSRKSLAELSQAISSIETDAAIPNPLASL